MTSTGQTRTHRFLGGISLEYVYLAIVTLVGLWLTPFLLRRIGQHDLGLWLVATQILGYLMLLDFGVVALLPRETAYATGRTLQGGDEHDLAHTIGRFRRVVRWQVPLVLVAAAAIWIALPAEWSEHSIVARLVLGRQFDAVDLLWYPVGVLPLVVLHGIVIRAGRPTAGGWDWSVVSRFLHVTFPFNV